MAAQDLIQGGPSIRAEMKSVSHLDRVRRSLPTSFSVGAGTIADDDLNTGVAAEPVSEHFGSATVEQIDRSVRLKVHEQRAVAALLTAQGNIVNTQDARATLKIVILERMQDSQERIRADGHSDLPREASATFSDSLHGKAREQLSGAVRPTSVASQHHRSAQRRSCVGRSACPEPVTAVHAHPYGLAAPREIERVPIVVTVLPPTQFTTLRTWDGHPRGFDDQDQTAATFDNDQNDAPAL